MEKINVMNKDNFNDLFEDNDVFGEAKNEEYTLEDGVTKNDDKRQVKEEQKEEQKETAKKQTNKIDTDKTTETETNSELQHDQAKLSDLKDRACAGAKYYSEERLAKIWLDYYTRLVKD